MQAILHSIRARLQQGRRTIAIQTRKVLVRQLSAGLAIAFGVTGTVMVVNRLGWLQTFEFQAFDFFSRHQFQGHLKRSTLSGGPPNSSSLPDSSLLDSSLLDSPIVVLEVAEADITALGRWPISDDQLAALLEQLKTYEPRAVGMDLYRDVEVPPGLDRLTAAYEAMPQLVGIEKAIGQKVPPSPVLASLDRVALADLVLDPDRHVRRGLISIGTGPDDIQLSLAAWLALSYLDEEGIGPEQAEDGSADIQLGKATFKALGDRSGGYQGIDNGGYQILMRYRGRQADGRDSFPTYSILDVLNRTLPKAALEDRIVLIGATAPSLNDTFATPHGHSLFGHRQGTPGVFIHAHLTRQMLTAALEGEGLLTYWAEPWEYLWIGLWAIAATGLTWHLLQPGEIHRRLLPSGHLLGGTLLLSGGVLLSGYGLFCLGWWVPVGAPLLAVVALSVAMVVHHNQVLERLALVDELTQVANRRYFDRALRKEIQQQRCVSLILCDIDYFKPYNDTYGHQAGDDCLTRVAGAIRQAVRRSDLVARYGGEEFAIILPNTHPELAEEVGERIRASVESLALEHRGSKIGSYVTLSCGVTTVRQGYVAPAIALEQADKALYLAKHQGRNCVVLRLDGGSEETAETVEV